MKFVVTGALGHIGSRLVRALPDHFPGCSIDLVDNLMTQRYPALFDLGDEASYRFREIDITRDPLEPVVEGADCVVHLAAITDAASSFGRADELEAVNYIGTEKVARACASMRTPLISLSSTSVYGSQKAVVDETAGMEDLNPQSPYADCKLKEERLLAELGESDDLAFFMARFGTIFGVSPGMRFHTAVNKFCWQAAMGEPLTVWSTAYEQKRPYLDLEDAVAALAHVIRGKIFDKRIYNVLTLNARVRDIVDAIRIHVPDLDVTFVDAEIMNQLSYEVSDARFRETGFTPTGDLQRGVRETIALLTPGSAA
ncbi:MAG: SDR family oxidoreductase [Alphaproteobacteria bacterium]